MNKRTVKKLHNAVSKPIEGLVTYSPLPSAQLSQIDPFLFLNHHGPQVYPKNNKGLPFGPHPHSGMETVTFILEGDIYHKDTIGNESIILSGGVQWMTAGRGLIHVEVSSDSFKDNGGNLEILQLWLNLPPRHKMLPPDYQGFQKNEVPVKMYDNDRVTLNAVSGFWDGLKGTFQNVTSTHLATIYFKKEGRFTINIPQSNNVFFYVIRGSFNVNDQIVPALQLVEFNNDGEMLEIVAEEDSVLLLGYAEPINEPVFAQGLFVTNTEEEFNQAQEDFRLGKFGKFNY